MIPAPEEVGPVHFVGIGGIGMSGIAMVLRNLGYEVQGSDQSEGLRVEELRRIGVPVTLGHAAANLGDARAVVVSSAVQADNPEIQAARADGIPVVTRAEMLAELMRFKRNVTVAGTHGKTTTTSLVAAVLDAAGYASTVINGGIIQSYESNARIGTGDWMVVEADESDGSFVRLPATVAVVTNIDPEHMDHYADFDAVRAAYDRFLDNVPFYGRAVCCHDHPETRALAARAGRLRMLGYGLDEGAEIRGLNLRPGGGGTVFDVEIGGHAGPARRLRDLRLPLPGRHNVSNALAAIAVGLAMGIPDEVYSAALAGFGGVGRRFSRIGQAAGVEIVDDYAHHPVEIEAALAAAREVSAGRVIAVHQPHRYTRLAHLFDRFCECFDDADVVVISDVYPAGENPIEGADRNSLVSGLRAHGHPRALPLADPDGLAGLLHGELRRDDLVICLGAGTITHWARALPAALGNLEAGR